MGSEMCIRDSPSTLQTEPRGEKHIFCIFPAKIQSLVLETQHLRIIFGILDPPGMPGARNPTFTNYFGDFGPTWDVWCWKPNIYELFLRFWTYTWDAWCWTPIFRENVQKHRFLHGLGAARNSVLDVPDEADEGKLVHDRHFGP